MPKQKQTPRIRLESLRLFAVALIQKKPLVSFFGVLGLLFLLIVIGSFWRTPKPVSDEQIAVPKRVEIFSMTDSPKVTYTASVEKAGVITIYAQSPGVVGKIYKKEGDQVSRGGTILSLSSTYKGGSTASVSRQIAEKSYESAKTNYDLSMDTISKQKELATKGEIQGDELREITRQSLGDTRSLITLNEDIISTLDAQIATLVAANVGGVNDAAILGAKQGKSAAQAGLNQLRSGLKNAEYQSDEKKTPTDIGNLSKDVALQQLELQARGVALSRDIAELNVKLARMGEAMMLPSSPVTGVVQRIHVSTGQYVNPGAVIATVSATDGENTAVVLVPREIAQSVARTEASVFLIAGTSVPLFPRYVSTEATNGNLYSILYSIPREHGGNLSDGGTLTVSLPLGGKKIVTGDVSVPLDSIYQTQEQAYVYVAREEEGGLKARSVNVTLGNVIGAQVTVTSGLVPSDRIIVSRHVQDGDGVVTQ